MRRIKTTAFALIVTVLLVIPSVALASTWEIDPAHSTANFKVKHMMISNVQGSFRDIQGTLQLDEQKIERSKVNVTIAADSIDTGVEKRDAHLRSADFFDVANYPSLTFTSKRVERGSDGALTLVGDLTIHGVVKEVALLVEGPTAEIKDPWGNIRKAAKATTRINRKDFDLTWNAVLETGGVLVGEEIEIELDVQFIKQAA